MIYIYTSKNNCIKNIRKKKIKMLSVRKIIFLLILIKLSISYNSIKMKEEREKMIKVLKENLKNVPEKVPDKNLLFLRNSVSTAKILVDYAPIGDLNIIKKKYNFPDEVLQAFRKVYKLKGAVNTVKLMKN